jgi:predicted enzyme related to lactoylglutathione lyase
MKRNPVNWFEIPVTDLARAKKFYEAVLDLSLTLSEMGPMKMAQFPMEDKDSPGASGMLAKSEGYVPSQTGIVIYFCVPDIDAVLGKIKASGGKTILPKTSIGEYGFIAHFADTEGNKLGLHAMPVK